MPQYNAPAISVIVAGNDIVLFWQTASGAVKTITGQNLANSLQQLMTFTDAVTFIASNTLLSTEQMVVANSGAAFTITLPSAIANQGRRYTIVNKGAGVLTVSRSGSDTIGGATSLTLAQYHSFIFQSDGQGVWFQISQ